MPCTRIRQQHPLGNPVLTPAGATAANPNSRQTFYKKFRLALSLFKPPPTETAAVTIRKVHTADPDFYMKLRQKFQWKNPRTLAAARTKKIHTADILSTPGQREIFTGNPKDLNCTPSQSQRQRSIKFEFNPNSVSHGSHSNSTKDPYSSSAFHTISQEKPSTKTMGAPVADYGRNLTFSDWNRSNNAKEPYSRFAFYKFIGETLHQQNPRTQSRRGCAGAT